METFNLAFTIEHTESYRSGLANRKNDEPLYKAGRSLEYDGGCVFRNIIMAKIGLEKYFNKDYSIFELQLPKLWELCVDDSLELEMGYGLLLENAVIIKECNV